jgi:hypothetical protein
MLDFFKTNKQIQEEKDKANKAIYLRLKTELKSKVEEITELMNDNDSTIEKKANGIVELYKLKDDLSSKWYSISVDTRQIIHGEYIDKDIDKNIDALKMKLFHIYAESVNGKVVNILDVKKFDRGCVYYKFGPGYILMELGEYVRSIYDDEAETNGRISDCYVFQKTIVSCKTIHFIKVPKVNDPSNAGGKPRRTRRHKNKKRRSSKQQKSKK